MADATEIANLEKENGERLNALIAGKAGVPVQLQPGTFELLQITTYLEHLLRVCDHEGTDFTLMEAKLDFCQKASSAIDKFEQQARKAALTNGVRP